MLTALMVPKVQTVQKVLKARPGKLAGKVLKGRLVLTVGKVQLVLKDRPAKTVLKVQQVPKDRPERTD